MTLVVTLLPFSPFLGLDFSIDDFILGKMDTMNISKTIFMVIFCNSTYALKFTEIFLSHSPSIFCGLKEIRPQLVHFTWKKAGFVLFYVKN